MRRLTDPDMSKRKTAAMLLVTIVAAAWSFNHIETLALDHHATLSEARMLPLSIDGLVAASGYQLAAAARTRAETDWLARLALVLSVAATVAANVAAGIPYGLMTALIFGWPAVAFIIAAELLIRDTRKNKRAAAKRAQTADKPAADGRPAVTPSQAATKAGEKQDRDRTIAAIVKGDPGVSVADLATMTGVSERTARRRLKELRPAPSELAELATANGHPA